MNEKTTQGISYPLKLQDAKRNTRSLASAQSAVMEAFTRLHKAAVATGALESRIKELMALAISITARCDDCIAHHIHDAQEAGATREEIAEAIGVAILMGGGPSMLYAAHAIEALDQFYGTEA
ncbi:MAG: carboxymuconolactone decarboxylase family protein [Gammaproteobacteria bacterium]|nr:carboxymuconolactone decarboxylase family protein [Gammaproteobacteria bacterium]